MIAGGMAEGTEEDRIHMAFLLRDIKAQTNAMFQLDCVPGGLIDHRSIGLCG
jgi:hypothetical protein